MIDDFEQGIEQHFNHEAAKPLNPDKRRPLVSVAGDFIKAYIIMQYAMLGLLLILFLFFRIWKCVKNVVKHNRSVTSLQAQH